MKVWEAFRQEWRNIKLTHSATLLVLLIPVIVNGLELKTTQTATTTTVEVRAGELELDLLGQSSPSGKIIFKIGSTNSNELEQTQWNGPELSIVQGMRLIPYKQNSLLVIDLLSPSTYEFSTLENGYRVTIKDAEFRAPSQWEFHTGRFFHQRGDHDTALRHYRKSIRHNPQLMDAYFRAGQVRLARKEYRKSEINLTRALAGGVTDPDLYRDLWRLYKATGKVNAAVQYREEYEKHTRRDSGIDADKNESGKKRPMHVSSEQPAEQAAETAQFWLPLTRSAAFRGLSITFGFVLLICAAWMTIRRVDKKKVTTEVDNEQFGYSGSIDVILDDRHEIAKENPVVNTSARQAAPRLEDVARSSGNTPQAVPAQNHYQPEPTTAAGADLVSQTGGSRLSPSELARLRRKSVGELELEMNMPNDSATFDTDKEIATRVFELHSQDLPNAAIAHQLGIGENEVELLLQFRGNINRRSITT